MEDNFRNTLIIISAVIIGAIFVHGLWTIRKNKNPYKLKASKEKLEPQSRNFDHGGFDQDGVGKIKVKPQDEESTHDLSVTQALTAEVAENLDENHQETSQEFSQVKANVEAGKVSSNDKEDPVIGSLEIPSFDALEKTMEEISNNENADLLSDTNSNVNNELAEPTDVNESSEELEEPKVILEEVVSAKPVYSQPVSRPKVKSKAELKRDQIEINFGGEIESESMPSISATESHSGKQSNVQPEVLALSVVMPQNQIMHGASLLPMLLTLGLKYGEMNIFHRHQDNAGTGPVTFSLANMLNPGSFDLDNMETFATQCVTLFMMLPNAGNAFDVYQQLLFAAKQLSEEFNAQILDDKRNVMTKQTEQHYLSRIRDFEIKNRTATG